MKMVYKTKMRLNKGSMSTTIPAAFVKLLNLEPGQQLQWTGEVVDNEFIVTVEPVKEE